MNIILKLAILHEYFYFCFLPYFNAILILLHELIFHCSSCACNRLSDQTGPEAITETEVTHNGHKQNYLITRAEFILFLFWDKWDLMSQEQIKWLNDIFHAETIIAFSNWSWFNMSEATQRLWLCKSCIYTAQHKEWTAWPLTFYPRVRLSCILMYFFRLCVNEFYVCLYLHARSPWITPWGKNKVFWTELNLKIWHVFISALFFFLYFNTSINVSYSLTAENEMNAWTNTCEFWLHKQLF